MIEFFKNLLKKIGLGKNSKQDHVLLYVKDDKCGNVVEVRAIKTYDLHRVYEDDLPGDYRLKKVIICDECYNKIHIEVFFDSNYQIVSSKAEGGEIFQEKDLQEKH